MAPGLAFTTLHFLCNLQIDPIGRKSVLHYPELERLALDKQSNLLDQFVSYEEN
jgi:hypothetical protein